MKLNLKLWQQIALVALTGTAPLVAIIFYVISTSINKDIDFGVQETRGNAYQRPAERLLDLLPQYQALARKAAAGDSDAATRVPQLQQQIDQAFAKLSQAQQSLGGALKFNDAELTARKRENARLSVVLADWQSLKNAAAAQAASDETSGRLVAAIRTIISHAGDTSNLILDPDLDSYYLMDITLCALPQTQDRLSSITLQVGDWLRHQQTASNRTDIAVMAAMLRQSDQDRITGDVQTALNEDKNFYGVSASLQKNLPAATEKYVTANQTFLALLDRVVAGDHLPDASALEAAGWAARAESFQLWATGVDELDQLLRTRVASYRHSRLLSYIFIGVVLVLVSAVIWRIAQKLNRTLSALAGDLNATSGQLGLASESIAGSSKQVAEGASTQAAALEETSAALEEITSMTKRNSENAANVAGMSQQANQAAHSGLDRIGQMERSLAAIKVAVGEMQTAVGAMQSSSQEISKIIKTIDEIAFQTNLLALNAAVEAARAGEAGAGFAVVADEVRALAQRSAQAARDTSEKIEAAVKRSESGVVASGKVAQSLVEVEGTAESIEQAFAGIVAQIKTMDQIIAEIAAATKEQSQGITEVSTAVTQMDKVTQSMAAEAEENASASAEMNSQADAVHAIAAQLETVVLGQASEVRSAAGSFESKGRSKHPPMQTVPSPKANRGTMAQAHPTPDVDFPMPAPLGSGGTKESFKDF